MFLRWHMKPKARLVFKWFSRKKHVLLFHFHSNSCKEINHLSSQLLWMIMRHCQWEEIDIFWSWKRESLDYKISFNRILKSLSEKCYKSVWVWDEIIKFLCFIFYKHLNDPLKRATNRLISSTAVWWG